MSHIPAADIPYSQALKSRIGNLIESNGEVLPENTQKLRRELDDYLKKEYNNPNSSTNIKNFAIKLRDEVAEFRRNAAPDLSQQYHDISSFSKNIKADTTKLSDNASWNVADALASRIENASAKESLASGRQLSAIDRVMEASNNDPILVENLKNIQHNAKLDKLYKLNSGSEHSMLSDTFRRLATTTPVEIAANASQAPLVKGTKYIANKTNAVLNAPISTLHSMSERLAPTSPRLSSMMKQMADSGDDAKKRAILNQINQMPSLKKLLEGMIPGGNEE
jgi:hypothetical protein